MLWSSFGGRSVLVMSSSACPTCSRQPPSARPTRESRGRMMLNFSKFIALLVIAGALALAQDRGAIRGTITDQSGAAVPEATVTVKNVDTGLTQTVRTSADGVYTVPYLPVGNYTVTTDKTGFRKAETSGVRVDVATIVDVDVKLTVGGVDQTVDVSASAPLLETQGTNLGKVVATQAISDLPLFISGGSVRRNLAFVILTPGVI